MKHAPRTILALLVVFSGVGSALAQQGTGSLKLQPMNFDMWCQETAQLPAARCDRRTPADDATFATYNNRIETYEMRTLRGRAREREINRDIVHYDPIGHPTAISAPQTDMPVRNN
jgi:hypothetical protein